MLYQNVADLNAVKNSLIDCRRIPKSKRNQQISLIDQFLIDLNEELININYAIPNYEQSEEFSNQNMGDETVEDFRIRINELIGNIQDNINVEELDQYLQDSKNLILEQKGNEEDQMCISNYYKSNSIPDHRNSEYNNPQQIDKNLQREFEQNYENLVKKVQELTISLRDSEFRQKDLIDEIKDLRRENLELNIKLRQQTRDDKHITQIAQNKDQLASCQYVIR
eukprot:403350003